MGVLGVGANRRVSLESPSSMGVPGVANPLIDGCPWGRPLGSPTWVASYCFRMNSRSTVLPTRNPYSPTLLKP